MLKIINSYSEKSILTIVWISRLRLLLENIFASDFSFIAQSSEKQVDRK